MAISRTGSFLSTLLQNLGLLNSEGNSRSNPTSLGSSAAAFETQDGFDPATNLPFQNLFLGTRNLPAMAPVTPSPRRRGSRGAEFVGPGRSDRCRRGWLQLIQPWSCGRRARRADRLFSAVRCGGDAPAKLARL